MAKKPLYVGIDVSKKELYLVIHGDNDASVFSNDADGRKRLVRFLRKRGPARVVVEVTGTYGLDLAMALHRASKIRLHYINPAMAKGFMGVRLKRGKSDRVDAKALARMAFCLADDGLPEWRPPEPHELELRTITRRIFALITERTRELNRLAALRAVEERSSVVQEDIEQHVEQLKARIEALQNSALKHVESHPDLKEQLDIVTSTRGIATLSGVRILGEYVCLPRDLTTKQIVAQVGLDPAARQSGSYDGPRHISKRGNRYLRAAMHMPAVNTVHHCDEVKAYYRLLTVERKKKPLVAYTAVARRLLVSLHVMLQTRTRFDPTRFYAGGTPAAPNLAA